MSRDDTGSDFAPAFGRVTTIGWVVGATLTPGQESREMVTTALPTPASSGGRTGPCRLYVQHRSFSSYSSRTGASPACAGGNRISTRGTAASGMVWSY